MKKLLIIFFCLFLCSCRPEREDYFVLEFDDYSLAVGYDDVNYLKLVFEADLPDEMEANEELKDIEMKGLGSAKKIIVEKDHTTLIDGAGSKKAFKERIAEIQNMIERSTSDYDKKNLKERLAKLTNGVAVIKVGATTETELKDKKLRIEDALNATKAAIEEGIVAGGGCALISVYKDIKDKVTADESDVQKGVSIVFDALKQPLYQIAENAGHNGKDIVDKQLSQKGNVGFDARSGEWVDMFKAGIVDPCKVTRSSLHNAASIAGLLISTEAAVGTIKEPEPAMPAGGMGGMY